MRIVSIVSTRRAPLCPAGHLPHKGGDRRSGRLSPIAHIAAKMPEQAAGLIPPFVWEMGGSPEGRAQGQRISKRAAR